MTEFLLLLSLWLLASGVGAGVSTFVMPRKLQRDGYVAMPLVGVATLMLLAATASYAGMTMHRAYPWVTAVASLLSAAGLWWNRPRFPSRTRLAEAACVHALGLVAACGLLTGIWLFNAWNPYSDAFTYVSIADFLQTHSFFDPAIPGAHDPVASQMLVYQALGFRMGANFLLAYHAAMLQAEYSFDVYMPTLALGLWLTAPAFWLFCRRLLTLRRPESAVAGILLSMNAGVSSTNAVWGFLPQTYGMPFALLLMVWQIRGSGTGRRGHGWLSAGLAIGVLLLTYPEVLPFVMLAIAFSLALPVVFGGWRCVDGLMAFFGPWPVAVLVAPVAAIKFAPMLRNQIGALVGGDIRFTLFDHLALLTGFRSLMLPAVQMPGLRYGGIRLAVAAGVLTAAYAAFTLEPRLRARLVAVAAPFVMGLIWFGMFVTNPWNLSEFGHPWSVFKLVTYSSFLFAVLWGCGLVGLWRQGSWWPRLIAGGQLAAFVAFSIVANYYIARQAATGIRNFTGVTDDPVAEYKRLRAVLAALPADEPVNLLIPTEALKHRQFVAYFLRRPVIANWSDDGYVFPQLEPENRQLPIDPDHPVLAYAPNDPKKVAANLAYHPSGAAVLADFRQGWYGTETEDRNWWRWLEQQGDIDVVVPRTGALAVDGDLAVVGAKARTVTIEIADHPELARRVVVPEQWFTRFHFGTFNLQKGRYRLRVRADGLADTMGPSDPRIVRLGVRNITWTMRPVAGSSLTAPAAAEAPSASRTTRSR